MKTIIFGLLFLFLSACTNQIKEVQELRNELRSREIEISSIYGSPGYQFGQAMEYFDAKDFSEAEKMLTDFQTKFPDWNKEIVADILKKTRGMKN